MTRRWTSMCADDVASNHILPTRRTTAP